MGPQEDFVETVFTCEGDINDPDLKNRLEDFRSTLKDLLSTDKRKLILKKVEPWNSVKVTFNIPLEAATRLKQLAQQGDATLKQLGVLAVQLEGDQIISLTIAGRNNEHTKLIFKTANETVNGAAAVFNKGSPALGQPGDFNGPGTSEASRKNIADYLKHGSQLLGSFLPPQLDSRRNINQDVFSGENSASRTPIPPGPNLLQRNGPQNVHDPRLLQSAKDQPGFPMFMDNHMNLPPPPPYPGIPATSPLLVNLLQTDAMANFVNSKMLPPTESSPPPKKKRKPRKPKEKNKTATLEMDMGNPNIPNPALGHCGLPTSMNSSSMPSMMVTQALPANPMSAGTCSALSERTMSSFPANSDFHPIMSGVNPQLKDFMLTNKMQHKQAHSDNTSGKIINPYTGILEPIESSDSSPCKSDNSMDSFSPLKKVSPKDRRTIGLAMCTSSIVKSVPSSAPTSDKVRNYHGTRPISNVGVSSSLHIQSDSAGHQFTGTTNPASMAYSGITTAVVTTAAISAYNPIIATSHSAVASESLVSTRTSVVMHPTTSSENGPLGIDRLIHTNPTNLVHESKISETSIHEHITGRTETSITTSVGSSNTDPLLNISHPNPAKNNPHLGSQMDSPGADSENSNHCGLLQDSNMQNEMGATNPGCHLEGKAYNHDSGVGSSSERSDDTPSEPGDDLKLVHLVVEENIKVSDALLNKVSASKIVTQSKLVTENCTQGLDSTSKTVTSNESLNVQSTVQKSTSMDLTVGYAMTNSFEGKQSDISAMMTMNKVLSHVNEKTLYNHIGKQTSNTVLHWSTTDKFISNQMETKKHSSPKSLASSEMHKHLPAHLFPKQHANQHSKAKRKMEHSLNAQAHFYSEMEGSYHPVVSKIANEVLLQNNMDVNSVSSISSSSSMGQVPMPNYSKQCDVGSSAVSKVMCNSDLHPSIQYSSGFDSNNSLNSVIPKDLQMQKKYSKCPQELKGKSPAYSNSHQMDSTVSTYSVANSMVEKRSSDVSQGNAEGITSAPPLTPKSVHSSDSSRNVTNMYRRKSPTGPGTSSNQQHFLNPGLPLAKSLTESVQKVVKALPSIESSTLPHQRKSPVNSSCKVSCSSSPSKPAKTSDTRPSVLESFTMKQIIPFSSAAVISETNLTNSGDLVNSLHGFNEHSVSSQGIEKLLLPQNSAPLPVLQIESSHELEFSNVPSENHLGVDIDCKQNFRETKSQSLLDNSKPSSQDVIVKKENSSNKSENCDNKSDLQTCEPHAQKSQHSDSQDSNKTKSVILTSAESGSTPIHEPTHEMESQQEVEKTVISTQSEKDSKMETSAKDGKNTESPIKVNHVQSKLPDTKRADDTNSGNSIKNADSKKESPKTSSKSKGSGDVNFKSKRLELEEKNMEVTVVTKVKPLEQRQQDKSEPTVPPIIIRVRKSTESNDASKAIPEVLAANTEESHLSMTLRGKGTSKSPEDPVHNLRHSKAQKQVLEQTDKSDKNSEKDSNKNVIDEDSVKRNLRRRKCVTNDNETEAKKPMLENEDVARHTRSNDLKESNSNTVTVKKADAPVLQKMDTSKCEEEIETSPVVDGVKSGLRARTNAKTAEDKQKGSGVKDMKKTKTEDENFIRNKQVSRQKKLSPSVPPEKTSASAIREKSPLRGSRTRGQTLPNAEDEGNKRSTRSAKTKGDIKDATDTLPPNSKRRRPSRDHR